MSSPVESGAARRRCPDNQYGPCMEFVGAGTPRPSLLPDRVVNRRTARLLADDQRYSATSAERYSIESALRQKAAPGTVEGRRDGSQYVAVVRRFGRES